MKMPRALSLFLRPLGCVYAAAMALRRLCWESGLLRRMRLDVPVISVGNISMGGTGKTPVADWIMGWMGRRGINVAVLTRGYGGKPPEFPYLVQKHHMPEATGDEPLLLARSHPGARVLVDHKRRRAASWARSHVDASIFLMDDGFQHIQLARDLDIVLLRPDDLAGQWGAVLPSGRWREGTSALKRASVFGIKMEPVAFERLRGLIVKRLGRFQKPIFSFTYQPVGLLSVDPLGVEAAPQHIPGLGGGEYVFLTGVANPEHARATASSLLGAPRAHLTFSDHHPFSVADIERTATRYPGLPIVCTMKDAVKISRALATARKRPPTWALSIKLNFGPCIGMDSFESWWEAALHDVQTRGRLHQQKNTRRATR